MTVDEMNDYQFNDNFQIVDENRRCVGVEYNQSEAEALLKEMGIL